MDSKLKDRIQDLAQDISKSHFLDRASTLQRFIEQELKARDISYTLSEGDIQMIKDFATKAFEVHGNVFLAHVEGTLNWLRSKDMLYHIVKLKE